MKLIEILIALLLAKGMMDDIITNPGLPPGLRYMTYVIIYGSKKERCELNEALTREVT